METVFKVMLLLTGISSIAFLVTVISYVYRRVCKYKVKQIYMGISLACFIVFGSITGFLYHKMMVDNITKNQNKMEFIMLDNVIDYASQGKFVIGDGRMGGMVFRGKSSEQGKEYYLFGGTKGIMIATALENSPTVRNLKVGESTVLYCKIRKIVKDDTLGYVVWGEIK